MPRRMRDAVPNDALYNLRDALAETQEQSADALNGLAAQRGHATAITGNHVSRWERGIIHPTALHRQLLAEHYGVTVTELGLSRQRQTLVPESGTSPGDILLIDDVMPDTQVADSQKEWLQVRRSLNSRHHALAQAAAQLYPEEIRLGETGLLARPDWLLPEPIDLANIDLSFDPSADPPAVDGTEEVTRHVRPLHDPDHRYQRYSHAIRDVAKPSLFENRLSWRLLDASFSRSGGRLGFGHMNYFDAMDTCEAVAHEMASLHAVNGADLVAPSWRGLKFRKTIGDPFDLRQRSLLMSINTLTIRRDRTGASVVLHGRNAANVATSGGIVGVMPAGVFQPSSVRAGDHSADFDLWRNIMREYSEEFLGNPEHAGDGAGADYNAEPLRSLNAAREAGRVRVYCFGLAIGALDLWGGLETVAVFDADVFDELFADLVRFNDEGTVLRIGRARPTALIPFTEQMIDELSGTGRMAPETAFTLRRAWKHRDQLLG